MKVLTFATLFPSSVRPGHGIFVQTRLRKLCERHPVELRVVAPVPWFPFAAGCFGRHALNARVPRRERIAGIDVLHPRYPVIPKVGMHLAPHLLAKWGLAAVKAQLAEGFDFDLIDAHYFYPDGVAAAAIARRLGKPLVITARGSDINLIARFPRPRRLIAAAARQASAVVTVSDALRGRVIELGIDGSRVHTLRNGVELDRFRPPADRGALRAALGFTRRTLLSVGNLVALKGHHLVIEALAGIPDADLVIVGDGEQREPLARLAARLGLSARVRLPGALAQEELARHFGAADLTVLASSREGWANVLLESMACGTPVLATPVGGNPEVVACADAGALARERSAPAIRDGCLALLERPPARAATRRYAEGFNWDETSDGQWSLFAEAASLPVARARRAIAPGLAKGVGA